MCVCVCVCGGEGGGDKSWEILYKFDTFGIPYLPYSHLFLAHLSAQDELL